MKEIQLTQGQIALISDEDLERISQYSWHAVFDPKRQEYRAAAWINGRHIVMHRFIMGVTDPKIHVDHKYHNALDNQRENLRVGSRSQNMANQQKQKGRASRFKGVTWKAANKKWEAKIKFNQKNIYLGIFKTEEEAGLAYNTKAKELFGEFAFLNAISA